MISKYVKLIFMKYTLVDKIIIKFNFSFKKT
jgi:hypothetical protein